MALTWILGVNERTLALAAAENRLRLQSVWQNTFGISWYICAERQVFLAARESDRIAVGD